MPGIAETDVLRNERLKGTTMTQIPLNNMKVNSSVSFLIGVFSVSLALALPQVDTRLRETFTENTVSRCIRVLDEKSLKETLRGFLSILTGIMCILTRNLNSLDILLGFIIFNFSTPTFMIPIVLAHTVSRDIRVNTK